MRMNAEQSTNYGSNIVDDTFQTDFYYKSFILIRNWREISIMASESCSYLQRWTYTTVSWLHTVKHRKMWLLFFQTTGLLLQMSTYTRFGHRQRTKWTLKQGASAATHGPPMCECQLPSVMLPASFMLNNENALIRGAGSSFVIMASASASWRGA